MEMKNDYPFVKSFLIQPYALFDYQFDKLDKWLNMSTDILEFEDTEIEIHGNIYDVVNVTETYLGDQKFFKILYRPDIKETGSFFGVDWYKIDDQEYADFGFCIMKTKEIFKIGSGIHCSVFEDVDSKEIFSCQRKSDGTFTKLAAIKYN